MNVWGIFMNGKQSPEANVTLGLKINIFSIFFQFTVPEPVDGVCSLYSKIIILAHLFSHREPFIGVGTVLSSLFF